MRDQSGNSRQNLCEHMLIFFWPISSSANTTALIYCRYIVNIYNRYIVNVIFSLEHCVAAWEHPLPSPSLLWVRTIWHFHLHNVFGSNNHRKSVRRILCWYFYAWRKGRILMMPDANGKSHFKFLTLDPPKFLKEKSSRLPFCVLSFVIWIKES